MMSNAAVTLELKQPPMPPQAMLGQMAMGFIVSQAITVAAKLRLADELKNESRTAAELAAATATHEPSLYRLMRALTSVGIFRKNEDGKFTNSPMSEFLRSDHPESFRAAAQMVGEVEHWKAHLNILESVKTGAIAFETAFGQTFFPYAAARPEVAQVFDDAMTSFSRGVANAVAQVYDFSEAATIADIGGGHGILLSTILKKNAHAKGILFDQPQVVAGAIEKLAQTNLGDQIEIVSGDFFKEISVAADVYLMKNIIHDWNDEQSVKILKNLANAAQSGVKLLLVESVVEDDDNAPSPSKLMDLNMLAMTGGKERTAGEYAALFEQTGFKLTNIYPTPSPLQIVEAVKI